MLKPLEKRTVLNNMIQIPEDERACDDEGGSLRTKIYACEFGHAIALRFLEHLQTMAAPSRLETLDSKPVGEGLSSVRNSFNTLSDNVDIERTKPLLRAVLENEPDEVIWNSTYDAVSESMPPPRPTSFFQHPSLSVNTGSFANSTEHRKHVDDVLRHLYVGIPGFAEAFFGDVPGLRAVVQAVLVA
ncbi:hypothetical protein COCC4DRAFT_155013 [Bipolaris maydis ATCC 48331]|uniref:Uncharacterized protein n=2 Tax=Cochliobolus heterostrophus TaxID=5016 RepID=M2UD36_COCH5|nr:uncharacterized protein COCC4DRAFT_155013 [Bipolaris maydis ATCC 48331]EMD85888.1 hypothetical protein COCHEDRAFT_1160833 [Bipolaris maydis C5]ENH98762.1 hypothetical protein COCC4DRAFT_155013 [Bipolaris maydis ATCC 48331]KAJ6212868.1 hypothetical protein PSV09DRAFT_1160833 [Bipolaris maydis]